MNIVLTGSIAIDRIMLYAGRFADVIHPEKVHVLSLSVLLEDLHETHGGVAANISYTLGLLGDSPILYGSVGINGREYMDTLKKFGVDTSKVHYSKLPTASFSVITDTDDCQVGGFYPGAMSDAEILSITEFAKDDVFVVISPHDPKQMAVQVEECKSLKKKYCYDIGQQVSNISEKELRVGLQGADVVICNDYEMAVLSEKTGWSQEKICKMVPVVVITLGAKGSDVYEKNTYTRVPALKDVASVDPTGAGDAYRAGFLYGYIRGESAVICSQIGSVAAAFCIESHGTQEHMFTRATFRQRYTTMYGGLALLE